MFICAEKYSATHVVCLYCLNRNNSPDFILSACPSHNGPLILRAHSSLKSRFMLIVFLFIIVSGLLPVEMLELFKFIVMSSVIYFITRFFLCGKVAERGFDVTNVEDPLTLINSPWKLIPSNVKLVIAQKLKWQIIYFFKISNLTNEDFDWREEAGKLFASARVVSPERFTRLSRSVTSCQYLLYCFISFSTVYFFRLCPLLTI